MNSKGEKVSFMFPLSNYPNPFWDMIPYCFTNVQNNIPVGDGVPMGTVI